jgi:tRNA-specific 2-thiouridylase
VVRLEPEADRLVVGFKSDLMAAGCRIVQINWLQAPPAPRFAVQVRLRYRSPACTAGLQMDDRGATLRFDQPQMAVTPGQSAVLYQDQEVLGAGWIDAIL